MHLTQFIEQCCQPTSAPVNYTLNSIKVKVLATIASSVKTSKIFVGFHARFKLEHQQIPVNCKISFRTLRTLDGGAGCEIYGVSWGDLGGANKKWRLGLTRIEELLTLNSVFNRIKGRERIH